MDLTRDLYLDLMKKCLTNWIYGDRESEVITGKKLLKRITGLANKFGYELIKPAPIDRQKRLNGRDWPPTAHTMIGLKRLDNIQYCVEDVLAKNIPGEIIECGVWRGGASIFMRAILKAHGIKDRIVYLADSFQGCPVPDIQKYPQKRAEPVRFQDIACPAGKVKPILTFTACSMTRFVSLKAGLKIRCRTPRYKNWP